MIVDIHPTMTDEELANAMGFDLNGLTLLESDCGVIIHPHELVEAAREVMDIYPFEPNQWDTKLMDRIAVRNKRMGW